jgi:hypothetical protein
MIQRCEVLRLSEDGDGLLVFTSCDTFHGISGSLLFVETTEGLVPVALVAKVKELRDLTGQPLDHRPPNADNNAGIAIVLTPAFFKIDSVPELGK